MSSPFPTLALCLGYVYLVKVSTTVNQLSKTSLNHHFQPTSSLPSSPVTLTLTLVSCLLFDSHFSCSSFRVFFAVWASGLFIHTQHSQYTVVLFISAVPPTLLQLLDDDLCLIHWRAVVVGRSLARSSTSLSSLCQAAQFNFTRRQVNLHWLPPLLRSAELLRKKKRPLRSLSIYLPLATYNC